MRRAVLLTASLLTASLLTACAPDLSKVAGDYSKAVDGANTALGDVVKANAAARTSLDYQTIALERQPLGLTPQCRQLFDLTAWSGGAPVVSDGAPNEDERRVAFKERRALVENAAKNCAAVALSQTGDGDPAVLRSIGPKLRDPFYLCGIDLGRLDRQAFDNSDVTAPGVTGGGPARIPPVAPKAAVQAQIMPALAAYAKALKAAAEAKDIEELESAANKLADSVGALAGLAGPYGVAAGPLVEAVGAAAASLTGLFLREKRFRFVKTVVVATDSAVHDSAAIACHGALLLSYGVVRAEAFHLDDLLAVYNGAAIDAADTLEADTALIAQLYGIDRAVVSARGAATADYVTVMLGIGAAHRSLKDAVEDPDTDFKATLKQLEDLIERAEDIQEATADLSDN